MGDRQGHSKRAHASVLVRIDAGPGTPLQRQIYADLRHAILRGTIRPGAQLPSSRALARDLQVSRTTTVLAYEQLTAEGYLVGRRGSGTFVADELPDDLARSRTARPQARTNHPPLSRRGVAVAALPSAARWLAGPARAFRLGAPGLDLFPLAQWSRLVSRRLRTAGRDDLSYGDPAGLGALREAIAAHVSAARGTHADPEQVLIVSGAQRGIELAIRLLLDPGDAAWLEDPGYSGARRALVDAGARVVPVPVDGGGLDVDVGARLAPRARLAYVTPSHQFPLGVAMTLARRLALLKWASVAGAWIIEDDYDSEFRYGARAIPCLHGLDADGRVIYAASFSKTLCPAIRLGFLLVPRDLRDRFVAARRSADFHPPWLEQAALADFIADGHFDRHLRRMRAAYAERLDALAFHARRVCGGVLDLRPVHTGLHAVADLSGADDERVFREAAARDVEVTPLGPYFANRPRDAHALVLGFAAVPTAEIRGGMERLAAAIRAARKRGRGAGSGQVA